MFDECLMKERILEMFSSNASERDSSANSSSELPTSIDGSSSEKRNDLATSREELYSGIASADRKKVRLRENTLIVSSAQPEQPATPLVSDNSSAIAFSALEKTADVAKRFVGVCITDLGKFQRALEAWTSLDNITVSSEEEAFVNELLRKKQRLEDERVKIDESLQLVRNAFIEGVRAYYAESEKIARALFTGENVNARAKELKQIIASYISEMSMSHNDAKIVLKENIERIKQEIENLNESPIEDILKANNTIDISLAGKNLGVLSSQLARLEHNFLEEEKVLKSKDAEIRAAKNDITLYRDCIESLDRRKSNRFIVAAHKPEFEAYQGEYNKLCQALQSIGEQSDEIVANTIHPSWGIAPAKVEKLNNDMRWIKREIEVFFHPELNIVDELTQTGIRKGSKGFASALSKAPRKKKYAAHSNLPPRLALTELQEVQAAVGGQIQELNVLFDQIDMSKNQLVAPNPLNTTTSSTVSYQHLSDGMLEL